MKRILLLLIGLSLLLVSFVSAQEICGNTAYNCPELTNPVGCCLNNQLSMCIPSDYSCEQFCCVSDPCSINMIWECKQGNVANCNVLISGNIETEDRSTEYKAVCCPISKPVWNENTQQCVRDSIISPDGLGREKITTIILIVLGVLIGWFMIKKLRKK